MKKTALKKSSKKSPLVQYKHKGLVAGCDEAGRGCLAGPVFAAAVVLPKEFSHPLLNDSKQLSAKKRQELRLVIEESAISYSVSRVGEKDIDKINILNASIKAMHLAVKKLSIVPDKLIIDGNRFKPFKKIPHECVIKGDGIYYSIAAASVLAKEYRDDYMKKLSKKHPCYCWETNVGYPTKKHRAAIKEHGDCKHHRKTFRLLPEEEQLELSFKLRPNLD